MQNIVVAFPGGGGGHFLLSVIIALYHDYIPTINVDGSLHNFSYPIYRDIRFLEGRSLDKSVESKNKEIEIIYSLPNFNITIGHFRYLDALVEKNKKVVYITFENDDIDKIYRRLQGKRIFKKVSKNIYQSLKGSDWPSYEDYFNNVNVPHELEQILKSKTWLEDWFYVLPENCSKICEIKFKEINTGYNFIDKLGNFFKIKKINPKIYKFVDEYRSKQLVYDRIN